MRSGGGSGGVTLEGKFKSPTDSWNVRIKGIAHERVTFPVRNGVLIVSLRCDGRDFYRLLLFQLNEKVSQKMTSKKRFPSSRKMAHEYLCARWPIKSPFSLLCLFAAKVQARNLMIWARSLCIVYSSRRFKLKWTACRFCSETLCPSEEKTVLDGPFEARSRTFKLFPSRNASPWKRHERLEGMEPVNLSTD